jgi:hypothetical protein
MLVPHPVQQQIVAQAPVLAYAPSALPSDWRFSRVDGRKLSRVAELFPAERLAQPALLRFVASARHLH